MCSRLEQLGGAMIVGHVEPWRIDRAHALRQHAQRGLVGEQALADPRRAGDQPGVRQPPAIERQAKRRHRLIMAEERLHSRSSSAATRRAVTAAAAPPASTTRTRSGAARAISAKASATRA